MRVLVQPFEICRESFPNLLKQKEYLSVVTFMGQPSTILFVEDELLIRMSLCDALPEDEFKSLVAASGSEALRILAQEHVDLMVTDLMMDGMNGLELAKQARLMCPRLLIIFMTGHFPKALEAEKLGPVMFKPVPLSEMENAIRQYLAKGFQNLAQIREALTERDTANPEFRLKNDPDPSSAT